MNKSQLIRGRLDSGEILHRWCKSRMITYMKVAENKVWRISHTMAGCTDQTITTDVAVAQLSRNHRELYERL